MLPKERAALLIPFLLVSTLVLGLSACGGSGSGTQNESALSAPSISTVHTDIIHYHPSFWEKWSNQITRGIQITFSFQVEDPDGLSDIDDIYVLNYANNDEYDIYAGPSNIPLEKFYNSRLNKFEGTFYTIGSLDRVDLTNWRVIATDKDGNTTEREFEFTLPNHEPARTGNYVHSDQYRSPDDNGVAALEAMTISENGLSLESDSGSQSFNIKFTTSDVRATSYSIAFYGPAPDYEYLGWSNQNSPSIKSTPIVTGQQTSIDLPWSEIYFVDSAEPSNIGGAHITLYNDYIENEFLENRIWFSYLAYSEYFSL